MNTADDNYQTLLDDAVDMRRKYAALEAQVEDCEKEIAHWKSEAHSYKPAWDQMKSERAALEAEKNRLAEINVELVNTHNTHVILITRSEAQNRVLRELLEDFLHNYEFGERPDARIRAALAATELK